MNLGVKIGLAVVGLAALGTGIYFAVRKNKPADTGGGNLGNEPPPRTGGADEQAVTDKRQSSDFPLRLGSLGRNVLLLQQALVMNGNTPLDVDGQFGKQTAAYVGFACRNIPLIGQRYYNCEATKKDFDEQINKAGGLAKVQAKVIASKPAIWNRYA